MTRINFGERYILVFSKEEVKEIISLLNKHSSFNKTTNINNVTFDFNIDYLDCFPAVLELTWTIPVSLDEGYQVDLRIHLLEQIFEAIKKVDPPIDGLLSKNPLTRKLLRSLIQT